MIEGIGIKKSFGDNQVLSGVDVKLHKGKVNMIIGKSGTGKSVLLKALVGLHDVDEGKVLFNNRDFTAMNYKAKKEIRKEIGMLFQSGALFDSMTVEENVKYPIEMFTEMTAEEMQERVDFCLNRVNIKDSNHLFPSEISGGMNKRVAIARAIALNPEYLFCDEPNSGLDPQTSILIDTLIKDITKEFDTTTVVISHDMNSVLEVADFISFVHNGVVWWEGTKEDILKTDNKEVVAFVYASEFMKNLRSARLKGDFF
ncbi:MAG: phospholipid/cholesterol/gamma-HCH transport system ATP-binding protein [Glaciecola sp.]